ERAAWLRKQDRVAFYLERDPARGGFLTFRDEISGPPISFSMDAVGAESLAAYLRNRNVATIEIADCDTETAAFFALLSGNLFGLTALFDSWPTTERRFDGRPCRAPGFLKPCALCAAEFFKAAKEDATHLPLALLQSGLARASRLVAT